MKTILNYIKKNRNIILLIISFVFLTMLILGMTYAYFDLKTGGETESTMNIGGAEISATYSYSNSINITDAIPSDDPIATKDFYITYKNTSNEEYKIYLKAVIDYNTFTDVENEGVLYYDIYNKTTSTTIQDKTMFPIITKGKAILKDITIPAKSTTTVNYQMKFYFPKSDKLQNSDKQLLLNANISIESDDTLEYSTNLLNHINLMYQNEPEKNFLVADNTSHKNIRYVGASPKNYIYFNEELWRIIGIFNVYNNETNQYEEMVKIVRNDSLGNYSWDTSEENIHGINNWPTSKLQSELNGDYLNTSLTENPYWYNGSSAKKTNTFDRSKVIKDEYQQMIGNVRWNLGGSKYTNPSDPPYGLPTLEQYNSERDITVYTGDSVTRATTWDGKIGLINASDYGYASTDEDCRNNLRAGVTYTNNTYDYSGSKCKNNNWLQKTSWYWSLTGSSQTSTIIYAIEASGLVNNSLASNSGGIYPTLYLLPNTKITSGTGEKSNPYKMIYKAFRDDSWETIVNNVKDGKGKKYQVGDEKEVNIGNNNYTVRLTNNSSPSVLCNDSTFSQTACGFVVEFVDIISRKEFNDTDTNVGGWKDSKIRSYLNNEFINELPADLKNIIIDTKVISGHGSTEGEENFETTDKLYLLGTKEVWGVNGGTAYNKMRQLDYYANNNVTINSNNDFTIKKYNNSNYSWWLRDAASTEQFYYVNSTGKWTRYNASFANGLTPAFRIG